MMCSLQRAFCFLRLLPASSSEKERKKKFIKKVGWRRAQSGRRSLRGRHRRSASLVFVPVYFSLLYYSTCSHKYGQLNAEQGGCGFVIFRGSSFYTAAAVMWWSQPVVTHALSSLAAQFHFMINIHRHLLRFNITG